MLISKILLASLAIEHCCVKENQRRIQRCVSLSAIEMKSSFCIRWKQGRVRISSSLANPSVISGQLGGRQDSAATVVLPFVFPTERLTACLWADRAKAQEKVDLWGSPPVAFFSAGHNELYLIVWDLEKKLIIWKAMNQRRWSLEGSPDPWEQEMLER